MGDIYMCVYIFKFVFNLQKRYKCLPQHKDRIKSNFNRQAAGRLRQMMLQARQKVDQKPSYIQQSVWEEMLKKWMEPDWKKKSTQGKKIVHQRRAAHCIPEAQCLLLNI